MCFAVRYVDQVLKKLKDVNYGSLATIVGRYYAMDRDKRWERIKIAYEALVQGKGEVTTPEKVIEVHVPVHFNNHYMYFDLMHCVKPLLLSWWFLNH